MVVVNPNAGIGKLRRDWDKISGLLDKQGFSYQAVFTRGPWHAVELVESHVTQGFRKIIAVGGDGTLNEVVNGIFRQQVVPSTDITVGMISVGTGNDWVRTYDIPMDYEEAILVLKKGKTLLQDAGIVNYFNNSKESTRYFINMAGVGFDGLVASKTNDSKTRGRGNPLLYLKPLIGSLFTYKSCNTRVAVNGTKISEKFFTIGVGIGQYNGGGMRQTPDAKTDDGLFDIILIKDLSKWSVIANVRRLYDGTIKKHKRVITHTAKTIRIECDQPVLLEADGESLGHSPFSFDIIPGSVRVVIR